MAIGDTQGALLHTFSFLNFRDLDAARLVSRTWNHVNQHSIRTALFKMLAKAISSCKDETPLARKLLLTGDDARAEEAFKTLSLMPKIPGGVHLGVGCFPNWDYAFAMRSRFVILVNHNYHASQANSEAIKCLRVGTLEEFESSFFRGISSMGLESDDFNDQMKKYFVWKAKPYCALRTDKGFQYLRDLALENRIVVVIASLESESAMKAIRDAVKRVGLKFSSLYLTNAHSQICRSREQPDCFKTALNYLKEDETCIFDR